MELKHYAALLWRWAWLIVICAVVAGLIAFIVNRQEKPVYSSSTTLLVSASARGTAQYTDSALRTTEGMLGTYAELLVKRPVLAGTIDDLGLTISPESLARKIKVTVPSNTLLLQVTVEDTDPERAAAIANQLVQVLNRQERELLGNPYAAYRDALQVIEAAQPRITPIRPLIWQNTLMAIAAGAVLAIGICLLIEHLNESAHSITDIQRGVNLPTLATVSRLSGNDYTEKLVTANAPRSPTAETYRMFLAHLEFAALQKPIQSLLVTSAEPNEGKSTTIANLASALAQSGKQVILVDMDLRLPTLHKFFKCSNQLGVTTVLLQENFDHLDDYLLTTGVENLRILPSGVLPSNPAKLVGSQRTVELIDQLAQRADLVLIDSPSALAVVDATLLARDCDATVLVVRAGVTRMSALQRTKDLIEQSGTHIIGVVLNRVSSQQGIYYYEDARHSNPLQRAWKRLVRQLRPQREQTARASGDTIE